MTHNAQSDSDFLRELATRKHFEYVASLESERDSLRAEVKRLTDGVEQLIDQAKHNIGLLRGGEYFEGIKCEEYECADRFEELEQYARKLLEETKPDGK